MKAWTIRRATIVACVLLAYSTIRANQRPAAKHSAHESSRAAPSTQDLTLRELADRIGFKIGATIAPPIFDQPQGLTDQFNMYQHREADPHPDAKPLPFDENYQRKPAYYGMLDALQERVNQTHGGKKPQ